MNLEAKKKHNVLPFSLTLVASFISSSFFPKRQKSCCSFDSLLIEKKKQSNYNQQQQQQNLWAILPICIKCSWTQIHSHHI